MLILEYRFNLKTQAGHLRHRVSISDLRLFERRVSGRIIERRIFAALLYCRELDG